MNTQRTPIPAILALLCLALALIAIACATDTTDTADATDATDATDTADATDATDGGSCAGQSYEVTPGAAQDKFDIATQLLSCKSHKYALCYVSGADPLPCTIEPNNSAKCLCQVFTATPAKPMYVVMTGILNDCAFKEAIDQCGADGSGCVNFCTDNPGDPQCSDVTLLPNPPQAYVCDYIANGTFNPEADIISTFSLHPVVAPGTTEPPFGLGCNKRAGRYAGCMTAACGPPEVDRLGNAFTHCNCPVWPSPPPDSHSPADPFQFGRLCDKTSTGNCALEPGQIWSAAYNTNGCPDLSLPTDGG